MKLHQDLTAAPVIRYVLGDLDHVCVVEDLAQVDAKINNLVAGAP